MIKAFVITTGSLGILSFAIAATIAYFNPCSWHRSCTVNGIVEDEATDYHASEVLAILSVALLAPTVLYLINLGANQMKGQGAAAQTTSDEETDEEAMEKRPLLATP